MSLQQSITIRQRRRRAAQLELLLSSDDIRLMCEGAGWRGETPGAFLLHAIRNAIAREHAAAAVEKAWSERPYDEC